MHWIASLSLATIKVIANDNEAIFVR